MSLILCLNICFLFSPSVLFLISFPAFCTPFLSVVTLRITTWILDLSKSNIIWYFYPSQIIQGPWNTLVPFIPFQLICYSCHVFFIFLLLFYKVNIHLHVPTVLYFVCYSLFPKYPSILLRSLSFSLENRLATTCDDTGNWGIHKSMNDHETLNRLLLASLAKRNDFSQKIPVHNCASILTYLPDPTNLKFIRF